MLSLIKNTQKIVKSHLTTVSRATGALLETLRDELGLSDAHQKKQIEALLDTYSLAAYLPDDIYDAEADIYPYKDA